MTQDKHRAQALNDDALEVATGGGNHSVADLATSTTDQDNGTAAPPGTPWATQLRTIKKVVK